MWIPRVQSAMPALQSPFEFSGTHAEICRAMQDRRRQQESGRTSALIHLLCAPVGSPQSLECAASYMAFSLAPNHSMASDGSQVGATPGQEPPRQGLARIHLREASKSPE